jgi:hypothetical protein
MTMRPEFGVITEAQVAAQYDQASGVAGWTAKLVAGKFELTPPPGYTVVENHDGVRRLVKLDWSKYGVRIGKINE